MRNNAPLPQPQIGINPHQVECHHAAVQPYRYITYDALENEWLGDPNRLRSFMDAADKDIDDDNGNNDNGNNDTENASNNGTGEKKSNNEDNNNSGVVRYAPGTLVWVLLSKGKQKQKNKSGNNNIDNDIINSNNQSHSNAAAATKSSASAASALQKKGRDKKHVQSMSRKNNHQQKSNGDCFDNNISNKNTTNNSNLHMDTVNDDTKATNKNGIENDNHIKQEINNINNNDNTDPPDKGATNKDNANETVANGSHDGSMTKRIKPIHQDNTYGHSNRSELFLRARVISDSEDTTTGDDDESLNIMYERRVLVRYSKGSTYRVHAYNLIPVLEPKFQNAVVNESPLSNNDINNNLATITGARMISPCVIITPETHIYRRIAVLHTTPEDSFIEIGCDYGITVDRIRRSLEEGGDVPTVWPTIDNGDGVGLEDANKEEKEGQQTVTCLGLDKSTESIDIATKRYPKCKFALADVLVPEEMSSIRTLCEQTLVGGAPSVIAIDVNGNREIDGVLQCLQSVMNERWTRQPRLIIVKSRFLYWDLKKE